MSAAVDQLIPKAVAGDPTALTAIVELIKDEVYYLEVRMLGGREDAEDATQDILIWVLNGLAGFRSESSFRTWVWRIATNHLLRTRRSAREKTCSFDALDTVLRHGGERAVGHAPNITPETRELRTRSVSVARKPCCCPWVATTA